MPSPKPVILTKAASYTGPGAPEPLVVIGNANTLLTKAAFQTVTLAPADAAAVAAQLKGLIDKLIAAGFVAAS